MRKDQVFREVTGVVLKHCYSHCVQLLVDIGKFLQAFVKVKVTRGRTVEEGGFEPGLKVDKDDGEGHLLQRVLSVPWKVEELV